MQCPSSFSSAPLRSGDSRNQSRKENVIKKLFKSSEERHTALKKTLLIISTVRAWTLLWKDPHAVGKVTLSVAVRRLHLVRQDRITKGAKSTSMKTLEFSYTGDGNENWFNGSKEQ